MATTLSTEKVTQARQVRPGFVREETFWVAYPEHVAGYGRQGDRVARATGRGKTRAAALADADAR